MRTQSWEFEITIPKPQVSAYSKPWGNAYAGTWKVALRGPCEYGLEYYLDVFSIRGAPRYRFNYSLLVSPPGIIHFQPEAGSMSFPYQHHEQFVEKAIEEAQARIYVDQLLNQSVLHPQTLEYMGKRHAEVEDTDT